MNKKTNIVLIGMPGSGKSTVGVLVAKALGMSFVDTDLELMRRTGRKLQEMLDEDGLESFLDEEETTILALDVSHTVIATGGSVVLEPEAVKCLQENGILVFLDVSMEELKKRITNIKSRGIAFAKGQDLMDIYEERVPLYRKYADVVVDKEGDLEHTVESVLREIML
ncbi:MAG: shikimate kinase [Eubacterium sp.]|nr:shikimate kinase [Eubacterium sp.]